MTSSHEKLRRLVEDDRLRVAYICGTQRSGSTITTKALAQVSDVAVDGLFSATRNDFFPDGKRINLECPEVYDNFCTALLGYIEPKLDKKQTVTAAVKGTSGRMGEKTFERWLEIPSTFLVTFRDPVTQFISLARASYGRHTKAKVPPIQPFIAEHLTEAAKIHYPHIDGTIGEGNSKRWDWLRRETYYIQEACELAAAQGRSLKAAFMDSTLMRYAPRAAWTAVFNRLSFDMQDLPAIVDQEWRKDLSNMDIKNSPTAYKARAFESTGIAPLSRDERVDVESLPDDVKACIYPLLQYYFHLLSSVENPYLPTYEDAQQMPCHGTDIYLTDANLLVADMLPATDTSFQPRV